MEGNGMEEEVERDMTPRLVLDLGMRYATESSKKKNRYGLYECQYCGKEWECNSYNIKSGSTKSCGCNSVLAITTHGLSYNRFYDRWRSIHSRCSNPNNKDYMSYGGRGISVCEEWLSATSFVTWCEGTYIEGMTLDRIDNDKGYSPENCRWVDMSVQNSNKGIKETNTSGHTGVTWHKNVKRWCSTLRSQGVLINVGTFKDKMDAVVARDNYIIENKLPHPVSSNYKTGENK